MQKGICYRLLYQNYKYSLPCKITPHGFVLTVEIWPCMVGILHLIPEDKINIRLGDSTAEIKAFTHGPEPGLSPWTFVRDPILGPWIMHYGGPQSPPIMGFSFALTVICRLGMCYFRVYNNLNLQNFWKEIHALRPSLGITEYRLGPHYTISSLLCPLWQFSSGSLLASRYINFNSKSSCLMCLMSMNTVCAVWPLDTFILQTHPILSQ